MGRSRGTSKEPAAGSSSLAQRLACVRRDEDSVAGSTRRRALFLSLVSSFSWIFTQGIRPGFSPPPRPPSHTLASHVLCSPHIGLSLVRVAGVALF